MIQRKHTLEELDECIIVWSVEDVLEVGKEKNVEIPRRACKHILWLMKKNHDAEIGITWETIEQYVNDYKNKNFGQTKQED